MPKLTKRAESVLDYSHTAQREASDNASALLAMAVLSAAEVIAAELAALREQMEIKPSTKKD